MGIEPSKRGGRAVGLVAVAAAADRMPAKVRPHRFTDLFRRRSFPHHVGPRYPVSAFTSCSFSSRAARSAVARACSFLTCRHQPFRGTDPRLELQARSTWAAVEATRAVRRGRMLVT